MKELTFCQQAERSIIKKYRKGLWRPFVCGVKRYELIKAGDRIAVCISGGKDSTLLAKLMQELNRHSDKPFELEFIVMDPGYNEINKQKIISNASALEIPIKIFKSDIYDIVANVGGSPCYLCARMRRGHLYGYAKGLGCNKIALGHHFSDVIETVLMGMFYGGQIQTMMPKLRSKNFPGMELIRPMYTVHEDDIIAWKRYHGLEFINCACRFTDNCAIDGGASASKRQEMKTLIKQLKQNNKSVEKNIFQSIHMVNTETIIGHKNKGREHSFLDEYD